MPGVTFDRSGKLTFVGLEGWSKVGLLGARLPNFKSLADASTMDQVRVGLGPGDEGVICNVGNVIWPGKVTAMQFCELDDGLN